MRKIYLLCLLLSFSCLVSQNFPYLNASTGNKYEGIMDSDSNYYYFHGSIIKKFDKNLNLVWAKIYNNIVFRNLLLSKTGSMYFVAEYPSYNEGHVFGKLSLNGVMVWIRTITNAAIDINIQNLFFSSKDRLILAGGGVMGDPFFIESDTLGNFYAHRINGTYSAKGNFHSDSAGVLSLLYPEDNTGGSKVYCLRYNTNNFTILSIRSLPFNDDEFNSEAFTFQNYFRSRKNNNFYITGYFGQNSFAYTKRTAAVYCFDARGKFIWGKRLPDKTGNLTTKILSVIDDPNGNALINYEIKDSLTYCGNYLNIGILKLDSIGNGQPVIKKYYNDFCDSYYQPIELTMNPFRKGFLIEANGGFLPTNTNNFLFTDSLNLSGCIYADTINFVNEVPFSQNSISTFTESGASVTYQMVLTGANPLSPMSNVRFCSVVGLSVIEKSEEVVLSPNPVQNVLYIKIASNNPIEEIDIFDVNGKRISVHKNTFSVDVSALLQGIYFLKIKTDRGEVNRKFIKE